MTKDNDGCSVVLPKLDDLMMEEDVPATDDMHDGEMSSSRDNQSIKSDGSGGSEMEPFEKYLPKIERLLSDIGLERYMVEIIQRGYDCQNCVYALKPATDDKQQYILRVPVCPENFRENDEKYAAIINDASLLGFLADKLPVPRVRAYSATRENALNEPFTVQTRLPGQSIAHVYEDLGYADKLAIVDLFVEFLAKLESITFAMAGTFVAPSDLSNNMNDFRSTIAPSIKIFDEGDEEFIKTLKCLDDRAGPDVKALLRSHLDGWIAKELKEQREQEELPAEERFESITIAPLRRQLAMLDALDHECAFKDGPFPIVLHHWDLEPRNIMVEKVEGSWKLCGIIDWDNAIALPRPLARKPPSWIWDFNPEEFAGYMDIDHHPNSSPDPNHKLSDENMALKVYFEAKTATVLPSYLEDAYGRGRWLRRIWRFARHEVCNSWYLELMDLLEKDWNARSKHTEPKPEKLRQSQLVESAAPGPENLELRTVRPTDAQLTEPNRLWKKPIAWFARLIQALRS